MFNPSILFEDNHLLVVEKPVNLPAQEDTSGDPDILSLLKDWIKQRDQKPGNVFLGLVHRLDRPAGGAMVFAKTSKAASRLAQQMQDRTFEKTYLSVVRGQPKSGTGRLVHWLLKDERTNTVFVVPEGTSEAKRAVLDYACVEMKEGLGLLRIGLETGRSHQIRVQLASMNCPIYGDQKYGSDVNKPGEQLALWATEICFEHPVKKERLTFTSQPPDEYPWSLFEKIYSER
ncbi:MAG TPA: RluA family pseudouridine synthase [Patescibacteria group bacterium]|nr:RluA family pseudouridine synthase [Patescibacteria group bacterium]